MLERLDMMVMVTHSNTIAHIRASIAVMRRMVVIVKMLLVVV
jgi:hypothetical protein